MTIESLNLKSAVLGFPRIGRRRELKFALEKYWSGKITLDELLAIAKNIKIANFKSMRDKGIDVIPSNDFSLYDNMLDTAFMLGALHDEYIKVGDNDYDSYFAAARGTSGIFVHDECGCGKNHSEYGELKALEMTKWFDSNYHYIVPLLHKNQEFKLKRNFPLEAFNEALAAGFHTRPVLIGPFTFLKLSKTTDNSNPLALLDRLLPIYKTILQELSKAGAKWVQIDEPSLVTDLTDAERLQFAHIYRKFAEAAPELKIMLSAYYGSYGDNLDMILSLPIAGLHIDTTRNNAETSLILTKAPRSLKLSIGIIDGRNIWRNDLAKSAELLKQAVKIRGNANIEIATSCTLLHCPIDLAIEENLDDELRSWLAFSEQKLDELAVLTAHINHPSDETNAAITAAQQAVASRKTSKLINNANVAARIEDSIGKNYARKSPYAKRKLVQDSEFNLPLFPTTTIGSFPQTAEVRNARSQFVKHEIDFDEYEDFLQDATEEAIKWQDEIGLDVLVHGEFERNDMVQYFGEQLSGFAFTKHAWVQSYGSRCVRPPIIYGDVSRPAPMTVKWWKFAQSKTQKPLKGMLTGPVTILNWSFVRDDMERKDVCRQIAFAILDEVKDLEVAGAKMIQIDEAALREGLPLKKSAHKTYLDWAVESFRICSSDVEDKTQIHTHMCYSEFNNIMGAIINMDADVISIETSRSNMELLQAFESTSYPNEIGPGVYDIHSPNIPSVEEMESLLKLARKHLNDRQIWVNPDCGLKTRKWEEVKPSLINMVKAAQNLRAFIKENMDA